uniref:Uncharacterized protein n=1 Tax=Amphiprion ocellaris TaxID=80972 RepID=A0AAQ6AB07_AMPOC
SCFLVVLSLGCSFCCETHPGAKGSNGNGSICNSTTVAHFAYGIATCVFAVLLYGTNLVPVKIIETGDGKHTALIIGGVCSAIDKLLTFPFIWPTGNVAVVPIIKAIGIGLGALMHLLVDILRHERINLHCELLLCIQSVLSQNYKCPLNLSCTSRLLSGLMWALATHSWFLANNYLSSVITFPIVTAGYDLIAALWGSLVLREIKVCIKALATVNNLGLVVLMLSVSAQFRKYDFTDLKLNCSPTEGISDFERKKVCLNFSKTLSW